LSTAQVLAATSQDFGQMLHWVETNARSNAANAMTANAVTDLHSLCTNVLYVLAEDTCNAVSVFQELLA